MKIGRLEFEEEWADTGFKRARGLMFRKGLSKALIFVLNGETRIGAAIHSLFVFFPFDIIWLSKDRKIVGMKTVGPWRLFESPKEKAKYFIELPAGSIEKAKVKIGDRINLD